MKKLNIKRANIFLLLFLTLLLCYNTLGHSVVLEGEKEVKEEVKTPKYAPGEVLVKFKEGVEPEAVLQELNIEPQGISRIHSIKQIVTNFKKDYKFEKDKDGWYWFRGKNYEEIGEIPDEEAFQEAYKTLTPEEKSLYRSYKLKLSKGVSVEEAAVKLKNNPDVEYAEPNYLAKAFYVPADSLYPQQWSHKKTHAEAGWDITRGSPTVVIAIIDTGVDYNHEDLAANIWRDSCGYPGKDFVDIDTALYTQNGYALVTGEDYTQVDDDPSDYNGHGTHVAGIAGAVADNNIGIAGVAHNCRIMPVRAGFSIVHPVYGETGLLEDDDIAQAITYAANSGAKVINMSFGGSEESQIIKDAIDAAYSRGLVLVAAAGNSHTDARMYPAGYENVIAVGASDAYDERAIWGLGGSNYGFWVDIFTPGDKIISTVPSTGTLSDPSGYKVLSGTSMASPYGAGLAGLILSRHPDFTQEEVRSVLRASADDIGPAGFDEVTAYGRVNNHSALIINYPCRAFITSPENGSQLFNPPNVPIFGIADGRSFSGYTLEVGFGMNPSEWTTITNNEGEGPLGTWDAVNYEGSAILRLTVMNTSQQAFRAYCKIDIFRTLHEGWPRDFGFFESGVAIGDLDGDTRQDLIFNVDSQSMIALRHNGEIIPGWPISGDFYMPAVGNIDSNLENMEVVAGTRLNGSLYAFQGDGSPIQGWPPAALSSGCEQRCPPMIADLNNDGTNEIVAGFGTDQGDMLYVFSGDGSVVSGWPQKLPLDNTDIAIGAGDFIKEDNGQLEVVVLQQEGFQETAQIACMIFDSSGNMLLGRPFYLPKGEDFMRLPAQLAIGDITGDAYPEIIFATLRYEYPVFHKTIHAFEYHGAYASNWPVSADSLFPDRSGELTFPSLGDLNNDGVLEILVSAQYGAGGFYKIAAFQGSGALLWSNEVAGDLPSLPLIADVDGDSYNNVIVAGKGGVYALDKNGEVLLGWPKPLPGYSSYSPAIGDVDGDSKLELLVGGGAGSPLYLYDLEGGADSQSFHWPLFGHDSQRTGNVGNAAGNMLPVIAITSPTENGYYRAPELDVQGNVTNDSSQINFVSISLDGAALGQAPVDLQGNFSYRLSGLIEGQHVLAVSAEDGVGEASLTNVSFQIHFPPRVTIGYPTENANVPSTGFIFKGTAEDYGRIHAVYIRVFDYMRNRYTVNNSPANYDATTKQWTFEVLPEHITGGGRARLEVFAYNGVDASNMMMVTIMCIYPPTITSISSQYAIPGSFIVIQGANFGVKDASSKIEFANGINTTYANIIYSWSNTLITCRVPETLAPNMTYKVRVINSAGRSAAYDLNIVSLPKITITYPAPNSDVSNAGFYLSGRVESAVDLASIQIYVYDYGRYTYTVQNQNAHFYKNGSVWNFYYFVKPTEITAGKNAYLYIIARDKNNISGYKYTVVKVVSPPTVTITSPALSYTAMPSAGFVFKGTAEDDTAVGTVRVNIYDYGRALWTVQNGSALYDPNTKIWSFNVLPAHITKGQKAFLGVIAKDVDGTWCKWQYRIVNVE